MSIFKRWVNSCILKVILSLDTPPMGLIIVNGTAYAPHVYLVCKSRTFLVAVFTSDRLSYFPCLYPWCRNPCFRQCMTSPVWLSVSIFLSHPSSMKCGIVKHSHSESRGWSLSTTQVCFDYRCVFVVSIWQRDEPKSCKIDWLVSKRWEQHRFQLQRLRVLLGQ